MSEELPPPKKSCRKLRQEEILILEKLMHFAGISVPLDSLIVKDQLAGTYGSIEFIQKSEYRRIFGKSLVEAKYFDSDGVLVSIALNVDQCGEIYEMDFWKVDFSSLLKYPSPELIMIDD